VDAYLDKAFVLAQMGKFDEAIELIKPFDDTDGRIRPAMALMYYMKDLPLIGDRLLEQSISYVDSLDGYEKGQGYMSIAIVKFSLADFTGAIKYSELAATKYALGLDADSYFFIARSHSALGDFGNAMTALKNGGSIGHSEVSLHFARAGLLIDQEKLDEAEQELQSALRINDAMTNVHAMLAFVHYQQGNLPRALVEAKMALQLNSYNAYAHTQLAYAYQAQGRVDEALAEAQEAVRLNTLDDTAHYILGVCYMESGKPEEAIREFEKFLDLYWDRAYVREYKVKAEEYLELLQQSP
jgi:tetratricopeptide (TPR) repeat protein